MHSLCTGIFGKSGANIDVRFGGRRFTAWSLLFGHHDVNMRLSYDFETSTSDDKFGNTVLGSCKLRWILRGCCCDVRDLEGAVGFGNDCPKIKSDRKVHVLRKLVRVGTDAHKRSVAGVPCLMHIAARENAEMVRIMCKAGAKTRDTCRHLHGLTYLRSSTTPTASTVEVTRTLARTERT